MKLNPPDTTRGHSPILSLFLANPHATLSEQQISEALPSQRISRNALRALAGRGMLSRDEHDLYSAVTPFPLSSNERQWNRRHGTDEGYTSAEARDARSLLSRRKQITAMTRLQERLLAYISTKPDEDYTEVQLRAALKSPAGLTRMALNDLVETQRILHHTPNDKGGNVYRLPMTRNPACAPRKLTEQHNRALSLIRAPAMQTAVATRITGALGVTPTTANRLIRDLFHAGLVELRPVGITHIVRLAA